MKMHCRTWLASALLAAFGTAPAWAQIVEPLTLNAGYTTRSDSNLFRLPANANVSAQIGKPSTAENIEITSLGVKFDKEYSLQRVQLSLGILDYQYQNFSYLSFSALNYNAAWRWSLTPRLHGILSSSRNKTSTNFADNQGNTQRNLRTDTSSQFDAEYDFGGPLTLRGGVSRSVQTNEQALPTQGDSHTNAIDLGLRYVLASGSSLSYSVKSVTGTTINHALPQVGQFDDGFDEIDHEFRMHWSVSGKSSADLFATHINRIYPNFPQRDFAGVNGGISLNWGITGKSSLSAGWVRELSSYQTSNIDYIQTDRFSLGPVWQASPKVTVRLRHEMAQRDYLGTPTSVLVSQRHDTTHDTSLSLEWQPYRRITLSASLQKARRTSNQAGFDYDSNVASFSAQFTYF